MLADWFTAEKGNRREGGGGGGGSKCRLMPIKVSFFVCSSTPPVVLMHVCALSGRTQVKMAEGSRDQGSVGTTDPEEDSPNMIVYRKVRCMLRM